MRKKVSIYRIASEVGVSTAAISRYFKKDIKLSKETVKKIEEVCAKYDYRPSPIASAMTTKRTNTIIFICPRIQDNTKLVDLVNSVSKTSSRHGYGTYLYNTDFDVEKQRDVMRLIDGRLIDGVIIGGHSVLEPGRSKAIYDELAKRDIPVVFTEKYVDDIDAPLVAVDGYKGGEKAAEYILGNGHRNIGIISQGLKDINTTTIDDRVKGFIDKLKRRNTSPVFLLKMIINMDENKEEIEKYLEENRDIITKSNVTAIFCTLDMLAFHLLRFLRSSGIDVPRDISVMGFANTAASRLSIPALTTMNNDLGEAGRLAVDNLINKLEKGKFIKKTIVLEPELVVRESVIKV